MASSRYRKFSEKKLFVFNDSNAGLFCLQVRGHHITPICDYEKTSMRMGAIYISLYQSFTHSFLFWLFIYQVDRVHGDCDTLSQGLEHSKVNCYLLLKLLLILLLLVIYWLLTRNVTD